MSDPTREELTALAIFSRKVRFVEWKAMYVKSTVWAPYFEEGWKPEDAYRQIDGERWIYVFRRDADRETVPATLVDELHLGKDRKISATPMKEMEDLRLKSADKNRWPERGKRPTPVPIGDSVAFVQRLLGRTQWHYFFASRIQLTSEAIGQLQMNADRWMEPVTFEADDPSSFPGKVSGGWIVPVLDPLTVALHLAGYYEAALDDFAGYTRVHPKMPEAKRQRVLKRNRMVMLADIINKLLDDEGTLRRNIKDDKLYDFRKAFLEQVDLHHSAEREMARSPVEHDRRPDHVGSNRIQ